MHVHRARLTGVVGVPHAREQRFAREHLPDVFEEQLQKLVFFERERNGTVVHRDGVAAFVERDAAAGEHAGRLACRAAQHRADARYHFHHAEGLREIVVRAGVQPDDLVILAAAGGGKYDGELRRERGGAQLFQYFKTVLAGEHDVKQHDIRHMLTHGLPERAALGKAPRLKAGRAQRIQYQLADAGVVFHTIYHKDAPSHFRAYHTI